MAGLIYVLCTATSVLCAVLLLRGYLRSRARLLLWSGLCFTGLGMNNVFLVLDRFVYPSHDLSIVRLVPALIGMLLLIYGLISEAE